MIEYFRGQRDFSRKGRKERKGNGEEWWLGAITNWDAREIEIPTLFLGSGVWKVEVFEDAPDADKNAEHYVRREFTIKAGDKIKVRLAPGGGFAARFVSRQEIMKLYSAKSSINNRSSAEYWVKKA